MKHNSYFEGKVQSLALNTAEGPATVGVIEPGKYSFGTDCEEHMHVVAGTLKAKLPAGDWERSFDKDHYFTRDVVWPHWSPDGTQIVFASAKDGNLELYTIDAEGQNAQRLTNNDVPDLSPSWSASGDSIIFVSERDGDKGIYVMDIADPENARLVTPFRDGGCPAWQPKARR